MNMPLPCRLTTLFLAFGLVWCVDQHARAAQTVSRPSIAVSDCELGPNGTWQGAVVTAEGVAVPQVTIELSSGNPRQAAVASKTDPSGRFRFDNLQPGTYVLRCGDQVRIYRLWRVGTAPPAAGRGALVVLGEVVYRGKLYDWVAAHPVITYVGIAAAIAVPVAVIGSAEQNDTPSSP